VGRTPWSAADALLGPGLLRSQALPPAPVR